MTTSAILLMAGSSIRFESTINKNFYEINKKPIFLYSLDILYNHKEIEDIYVVVKKEDLEKVDEIIKFNYSDKVQVLIGGSTRGESVRNALNNITSDIALIHDAARPLITTQDIDNIIETMNKFDCATLYHNVYDTIKQTTTKVETISRDTLKAVTTPQAFKKELYSTILNNTKDVTDELALFENDKKIGFVKESRNNLKITTKEDLNYIEYILMDKSYKVGHSFDFHQVAKNRTLILGGVKFDTDFGLLGHSDADVVYHAVTEAILGALSLGDIGTHFPDTDSKYLNMDSSYFVKEAVKLLNKENYTIENIDVIIYLEEPNLKNYKVQMAKNIKQLTNASYVNVKATTLEKKGPIGAKEGIASEAVILIKK